MASVNNILSPESSITSLLSSSGCLKNSLASQNSQAISFRDRQYESATEALDAYIADFQRSLYTTESSKSKLPQSKCHMTPTVSGIGFKNHGSDKELDHLNPPAGSHKIDEDCLSLTTDDLLNLPPDGSLPLTGKSAFLAESCYLSHRPKSGSLRKSTRLQRQTQGSSVLDDTIEWKLPGEGKELKDSLAVPSARRARETTNVRNCITLPVQSTHRDLIDNHTFYHYPRWLTSQRSLLNFSDVSSLPDTSYPTWLKYCEMPANSSGSSTIQKNPHILSFSSNMPCRHGDLDKSYKKLQKDCQTHWRANKQHGHTTCMESADHRKLRKLRLEFLEAEESGRTTRDKALSDDKIGFLIQKAEKALSCPSLGFPSHTEKHNSTQKTEQVLDGHRSRDDLPVILKPPEDRPKVKEPKGRRIEEDLSDKEGGCSSSSGYGSRKHPGPVEALKQMLFSLQAVEQKVVQKK